MEIKVVTYNVHSCIGTDGRNDPMRIAKLLSRQDADIIALQELDSGLARTGKVDQAALLADMLAMEHHFHPSFYVEAGQYGNAVLSLRPSRLFHAGRLPTLPGRKPAERRGALWLKVDINGTEVNVFNTHLGLNRHERLAQAAALAGPEWLGHPECRGPVILCGDLNASTRSRPYRIFRSVLVDACRGRTWPGRFPVLQLDHIFVSPGIRTLESMVLRDALTRRASDHLPVIARLDVPAQKEAP